MATRSNSGSARSRYTSSSSSASMSSSPPDSGGWSPSPVLSGHALGNDPSHLPLGSPLGFTTGTANQRLAALQRRQQRNLLVAEAIGTAGMSSTSPVLDSRLAEQARVRTASHIGSAARATAFRHTPQRSEEPHLFEAPPSPGAREESPSNALETAAIATTVEVTGMVGEQHHGSPMSTSSPSTGTSDSSSASEMDDEDNAGGIVESSSSSHHSTSPARESPPPAVLAAAIRSATALAVHVSGTPLAPGAAIRLRQDAAVNYARLRAILAEYRQRQAAIQAATRAQHHARAEAERRAALPPERAEAVRTADAAAHVAHRAALLPEQAAAERAAHTAAEAARRAGLPQEQAATERAANTAAQAARRRAIRVHEAQHDPSSVLPKKLAEFLHIPEQEQSSEELLCGPGGAAADEREIQLGSGGLTADVQLAVALQHAYRRHLPSAVCVSCGCYRPAGKCTPRLWPDLELRFELLRLDIAGTPAVQRSGLTRWQRLRRPGEPWREPLSPPPHAAFEVHRGPQQRRGAGTGATAVGDEDAAHGEAGGLGTDEDEEEDVLAPYRRQRQREIEEVEAGLLETPEPQPAPAPGDSPAPTMSSPSSPLAAASPAVTASPLPSPAPSPPPPAHVAYAARVLGSDAGALQNLWLDANGQPERLRVCDDCQDAFDRGRVPGFALAVVDTGDIPHMPNGEGAPLLTMVERRLVAMDQLRMIVMYIRRRDIDEHLPVATLPRSGTGHTIAFPNASPADLMRQLASRRCPAHPDQLPDRVRVIFADAVASDEELARLLRSTQCLMIRPPAVLWWAQHICNTYGVPVNAAAVEALQRMGAGPVVPDALIAAATAPRTEADAAELQRAFVADREGPARVRQQADDLRAAQQAAAAEAATTEEQVTQAAAAERVRMAAARAELDAAITAAREPGHQQQRGRGGRRGRGGMRLNRNIIRLALQLLPWTPEQHAMWRNHQWLALATQMQLQGSPARIDDLDATTVRNYLSRQREALQPVYEEVTRQQHPAVPAVLMPAQVPPAITPTAQPAVPVTPVPATAQQQPQPVTRQPSPAVATTARPTPGRAPPPPGRAVAAAGDDEANEPMGPMTGITDAELAVPNINTVDARRLGGLHPEGLYGLLESSGCIISAAGGRGIQPISDYVPSVWVTTHPCTFPNGYCGMRPPGMQEDFYLQQLLRRYPARQFGEQPDLLWHASDALTRHHVNLAVNIATVNTPHALAPVRQLSVEDARAAAVVLSSDPHSTVRRRALANAPVAVRRFADSIRVGTARVDGTDAFYQRFRSRLLGANVAFGASNFFYTINFSDLTAVGVAFIAGQTVTFDSETGAPTDEETQYRRWERSARSPVACAENARAIMAAFTEVMFNWDLDGRRLIPGAGRAPVGPTTYNAHKSEVTGRGALHAHGEALIEALDIHLLERQFHNAVGAMRQASLDLWPQPALQLAEALGRMTCPAPFEAPPTLGRRQPEPFEPADDLPRAELATIALPVPGATTSRDRPATYSLDVILRQAGWPCAQLDTTEVALDAETAPPALRWPRMSTTQQLLHSAYDRVAIARHVTRCVLQAQIHHHTSTCWKISQIICRMIYGRDRVLLAEQLSPDGPLLLLQRTGEMVVPHMVALLLAFGCNNSCGTVFDVGRELAPQLGSALLRWRATPQDRRGPCPLNPRDNALDQSFYMSKYEAKDQSDVALEALMRAAYRLTRGTVGSPDGQPRALGAPVTPTTAVPAAPEVAAATPQAPTAATAPAAPPRTTVSVLQSAIHAATGKMSRSLAMAAFQALGYSTAYCSWDDVPLDVQPLMSIVLTGNTQFIPQHHRYTHDTTTRRLHTLTNTDNIIYRGPELDSPWCGAYLLTAIMQSRKKDHLMLQQEQEQRLAVAEEREEQEQQQHPAAIRQAEEEATRDEAAAGPPATMDAAHEETAAVPDVTDDAGAGTVQPAGQYRARPGEAVQPRYSRRRLLRVGFMPPHPQAETHMLVRRSKPLVVRLLSTPPQRPDPDDTSPAAQDWYVWCLALFHPLRGQLVVAPDTARDVWVRWYDELQQTARIEAGRQHKPHAHYVAMADRIMRNAANLASAIVRGRDRAKARRQAIRRAEREAAHGTGPHDEHDTGSQASDDDDDDAGTGIALEPEGPVDTEEDNPTLQDLANLNEILANTPAPGPTPLTDYAAGAMAQLPPFTESPIPVGEQHAHETRNVRLATPILQNAARLWISAAKTFNPNDDTGDSYRPPAGHQLRLQREADGRRLAHIFIRDSDGDAWRDHGPVSSRGRNLPFYHLSERPSQETTAALFTLNLPQLVVFLYLTDQFLCDQRAEENISHPAPHSLRCIVQGGPGAGKTQLIRAVQWFAFQHGFPRWITATAYTWRAAGHHASPCQPPLSTSTMFGLNANNDVQHTNVHKVNANFPGRLCAMDEFSMTSAEHLGQCDEAANAKLDALPNQPAEDRQLMNGRSLIQFGDICQLPPPGGVSVMYDAARILNEPGLPPENRQTTASPGSNTAVRRAHGLDVWRASTDVFFLEGQERFLPTGDGQRLQQAVQLYGTIQVDKTQPGAVQEEQRIRLRDNIATLVDTLNRQIADFALPPGSTLYPERRRLVTPRNQGRHELNLRLAARDPARGNQRIIAWNAVDHAVIGRRQPTVPLTGALAILAKQQAPDNVKDIAPTTYYYEGILYTLLDNTATGAGRRRNTEATGRGIILDPREPPDRNPSSPIRHLQYPPAIVFVEPADTQLGNRLNARLPPTMQLPPNTIALVPGFTSAGSLRLPEPVQLPGASQPCEQLSIKRYGIPVGSAYAVTDFFVEGCTIANQWWALELTPPPWGRGTGTHVSGRSLYVCLSRFTRFSDVRLLRPLYTHGNAEQREHIIQKFTDAAIMSNDLQAEILRLRQLATATQARHQNLFRRAEEMHRLIHQHTGPAALTTAPTRRATSPTPTVQPPPEHALPTTAARPHPPPPPLHTHAPPAVPLPQTERSPATARAPPMPLQYSRHPPPHTGDFPPPALPATIHSLATQAAAIAAAHGPAPPPVWFGHDFSDWERLLQSTQQRRGQLQITSSWLFMPLIADALLPTASAHAAFPFQRPPDWQLLTEPLRTGCAARAITADRIPLDAPWHATAAWQEYVLNTALEVELVQTLAALAASCQSGQGWADVQATLHAQQLVMLGTDI